VVALRAGVFTEGANRAVAFLRHHLDVTSPPGLDHEVTGLGALASDQAKARTQVDAVYDTWYSIEGTIKQNSSDLYLDMEDGLGAVKNGVDQNDAAKAKKGSTDFSAAASKYLQEWPGTGGSTTTKAP
jgi:hypothetical protein